MKQFLFAIALLLLSALSLSAQSGNDFFLQHKDINDTLIANTTFTYDFNSLVFAQNGRARDITDTWSYSVTIEADSISGAAADSSTVFLQVCNCSVTETNPLWVTIEQDEINGTATQVFHYTGDILEPRIRVLAYSKSGVKKIALRSYATFKRKYKTR